MDQRFGPASQNPIPLRRPISPAHLTGVPEATIGGDSALEAARLLRLNCADDVVADAC